MMFSCLLIPKFCALNVQGIAVLIDYTDHIRGRTFGDYNLHVKGNAYGNTGKLHEMLEYLILYLSGGGA
jgi:hypothetical protein